MSTFMAHIRMRDCNVITHGLEEATPDNAVKCTYKEVVIVGNGPSAISLSYILSGYRPYYNRIPHPDPMLSARLIECTQKSLLHQDLPFLAQGLEGRSKNPISLLIDAMTHPGADMGLEWPSLLTWKKTAKSLDHIVLGKGEVGGTWPEIAHHILTISPGRWMSLPGMEFKEFQDRRAPASAVAKYYQEYVKKNYLSSYINSFSTVTMIQPITCKSKKRARWKVWVNEANGTTSSFECRHLVLATGASDRAGCLGVPGESLSFVSHDLKSLEDQLSCERKKKLYILENGIKCQISPNGVHKSDDNVTETNRQRIEVKTLSDIERDSSDFYEEKISVVKNIFKEDEDIWFNNDIPSEREFDSSELVLNDKELITNDSNIVQIGMEKEDEDENVKVLVVGAGLSAADAILTAWRKNLSVVHAFRSPLTTAQLPALIYPEYHELYQLMEGSALRKDYQPLPGHQLVEVYKDNTVQLVDSSGNKKILKVYSVAIFIGSQPDLFFLPKSLKNLGVDVNKPVDCKVNPVQIDPFTYKCVRAPSGLYALGPLVGDNFVRFLQGGAVAVASHIFKDNSLQKTLNQNCPRLKSLKL